MKALLAARNVSVQFPIQSSWFGGAKILRAVEDVSFEIQAGETFALVGESGSGKTTLGRVMAGLRPPTVGQVMFNGEQIKGPGKAPIEMVFQDPFSALDPRMLVGDIITEPLRIKTRVGRQERLNRAAEFVAKVGLPTNSISRYPHEFSGGQRQRIAIARALVSGPSLIIADEPLSALDVSVQSQVMNLMKDIQEETNVSYLFISHDLAAVHHLADRVAVLYLGRIMEVAPRADLFARSRHPYTQALLRSIPRIGRGKRQQGQVLKGEIPSPLNPPAGCVFHTRCPHAQPICRSEEPKLLATDSESHHSACHFRSDI